MNRTERFEEQEIERVLDSAYDSSFAKEVGRVAIETPPIYFSSPKRAVPEDFGWCDMGTYLEGEA